MQPISVGNFDYTQDENGGWIFKAKQSTPLSSVKKEKPKYREQPQFKLNETIEGKSKIRFAQIINHTALELINYLKENLK